MAHMCGSVQQVQQLPGKSMAWMLWVELMHMLPL